MKSFNELDQQALKVEEEAVKHSQKISSKKVPLLVATILAIVILIIGSLILFRKKPDYSRMTSVPVYTQNTPQVSSAQSGSPALVAVPTPENSTTDLNRILYDENGIVVTLVSIEQTGVHDYIIRTSVENNTPDEYSGGHIIANSAYADETNIQISWEGPFSVPAGKAVTFRHYIHPKDFEEAGKLNGFETLEFQITLSKDNYLTTITVDGSLEGVLFQ